MDAKVKNGINEQFCAIFSGFAPEKIAEKLTLSRYFACFAGTSYQVDITNVFYELAIPSIWITPRYAVTCVGGSNVQYSVTGTNIPKGLTWSLYQTNFAGHAVLQTNTDWQYASVTPGNVATNYKVRATSKDNTNFYDEVKLTVVKVDIVETNVYVAVSNTVSLHLTSDSTPNTQWEIRPILQNGAYIQGSSVGASVVINAGSILTNYTVKAYAKDLINCYDTCTVTVVKVESVDVHFSDTNTYKITSILTNGMNHFVCVKNTGDIILDATVAPTDIVDMIAWDADGATITSPAVSSDKTTAKLASTTSQKIPVRITVGGNTCWSGTVWVVWSTVSISDIIPINIIKHLVKTRIKGGYIFHRTIQPASIIPTTGTDDVPDLTGSNNPAYPPPNVPESDTSVFQKDFKLTNGVNAKWDCSRQARQNIINPDNLFFPFEADNPKSLFTTYSNFPSDLVVGNDDIDFVGEDNNPYADPDKGKLTDFDCPAATPLHSEGSLGNTFEIHFHTREFSRLQLKDKWYRISDDLLWKIHWKFKKVSEAEIDQDYNEDGDKLDEVWIDNGSFIATDNNDF